MLLLTRGVISAAGPGKDDWFNYVEPGSLLSMCDSHARFPIHTIWTVAPRNVRFPNQTMCHYLMQIRAFDLFADFFRKAKTQSDKFCSIFQNHCRACVILI